MVFGQEKEAHIQNFAHNQCSEQRNYVDAARQRQNARFQAI